MEPPQARSLGPKTLTGRFVALEPLAEHHREGLAKAGRDPGLWEFLPIDGSADFTLWWDAAMFEMATASRIPYAVRRLSDKALLGSTSYLADVPAHARVEIGWTWYVGEAQGTMVNPEAKLLLLTNAFEAAGYNRVELKTGSKNVRSRAAIEKLGAREEGILRNHIWMPRGVWRDTVTYSILRSEWPGVKARLERRLKGVAGGADTLVRRRDNGG